MNRSHPYSRWQIWCSALLLPAIIVACGHWDGGTVADATAPTVTLTNPADGATGVALNSQVTATFSEAMDPATLNTSTFTLTGPGTTPVSGTVNYVPGALTATFAPDADLAASTTFTATVTSGAQDLAGNALIAGPVPNPWTFTTGAAPDTTAPTITSTSPPDLATGVCIQKTVNATFSEAMDPLTLTTTTFTLSSPGPTPISGVVTYDTANDIATFTADSNLAGNTVFTATVTTGAEDLAGNALASGLVPNPWSFETGTQACSPAAPIALGAAEPFGIIGGSSGMTNQGTLTTINGDIGTTGASTTVTGFHDNLVAYMPPPTAAGCTYTETTLNIGEVNGLIYTAPPPPTVECPDEGTTVTFDIATAGRAAAQDLWSNVLSPAALPGGIDPGAGQLGGLTLAPGVYMAASGSFLIAGTDLTLDGQGDTNSVWVFQSDSSLTVGGPAAPRSVILINGASSKNVFWRVGSAATINEAGGGTMEGTIVADAGVTFSTAGNVAITTLNGRALGLNASVTVVNTVINVPAP